MSSIFEEQNPLEIATDGVMPIDIAATPNLIKGWDAAFCPNPLPDTLNFGEWNEVYIGGSSALRRQGWGLSEMQLVANRKCLPVYVPTPGFDNPRQAALDCIQQLRRYHVPAYATPWRVVMWDMETGIEPDAAWFTVVHSVMIANGYGTSSYGSRSWAFGEPNYMGLIIADYDGNPDFSALQQQHPGALIVGKQYAAGINIPGGQIDLDAITSGFLAHLGQMHL